MKKLIYNSYQRQLIIKNDSAEGAALNINFQMFKFLKSIGVYKFMHSCFELLVKVIK